MTKSHTADAATGGLSMPFTMYLPWHNFKETNVDHTGTRIFLPGYVSASAATWAWVGPPHHCPALFPYGIIILR